MKISLLFGFFPEDCYKQIINNSKGVIQYAADALQKSIIEGIGFYHKDLSIINLPYIGSFPLRYNTCYFPKGKFEYRLSDGNNVYGENIRFCNLSIYKMWSRYINAYKGLKTKLYENILSGTTSENIVVVYAIHSPFLMAAARVKKKFTSNTKIVLIVPDLPEYMGASTSLYRKVFDRINKYILKITYKQIDAFVLLSKFMTEILPVGNRPWVVVEGIFNSFDGAYDSKSNSKRDTETKIVFYSGTLAKRYGIMNLVQAIAMLPDKNIRLQICGDGDSRDEIINYALKDTRIEYLGQQPRHEVIKKQRLATLLVNPRTPEGEYTKYSFPSKTMEYFASGRPTLLYKLQGIPDEYYNYCYTIDELGVEPLSKRIYEILKKDEQELNELGKRAQDFILNEKNPYKQCEKILDLINNL